jgi:DMSO/TMAO reductase YedYZ molybdopterin-dependent catalytic subunit
MAKTGNSQLAKWLLKIKMRKSPIGVAWRRDGEAISAAVMKTKI